MKYFVLLLLVLLFGCSRNNFSVGDCVSDTVPHEKWEQMLQWKIIEVGERSYRVIWWNELGEYVSVKYAMSLDMEDASRWYVLIKCPEDKK